MPFATAQTKCCQSWCLLVSPLSIFWAQTTQQLIYVFLRRLGRYVNIGAYAPQSYVPRSSIYWRAHDDVPCRGPLSQCHYIINQVADSIFPCTTRQHTVYYPIYDLLLGKNWSIDSKFYQLYYINSMLYMLPTIIKHYYPGSHTWYCMPLLFNHLNSKH